MFRKIGSTSQSILIQIVDDAGLPVTGLVAATFPALYYYGLYSANPTSPNFSSQIEPLIDFNVLDPAWAAGTVYEFGNGHYRIDVPNDAFNTAAVVRIVGETTGKRVNSPWIDVGMDLSGTTVGDVATLSAAQAEPGQGTPPVNATPLQKLAYLFKGWRNRKTQTATQYSLYNDDAATVDQKADVSDVTGTTTIGEVVSGP